MASFIQPNSPAPAGLLEASRPALEGTKSRGFRVEQLDYGRAPQMDTSGYEALRQVGGWGRTLKALGGKFSDMGAQRSAALQWQAQDAQMQEARRTQQLTEAELMMDRGGEEISRTLASDAHRDKPDSWLKVAGDQVQELGRMLMPKEIDSFLREKVGASYAQWADKTREEVRGAAVGRQRELTVQTLAGGFQAALEKRRYDKAAEAVDGMRAYVPQPQLEQYEARITQQRQDDGLADYLSFRDTALKHPDRAKGSAAAYGAITQAVEQGYIDAKRAQKEYRLVDSMYATNLERDDFQALQTRDLAGAEAALLDEKRYPRIVGAERKELLTQVRQTRATQSLAVFNEAMQQIDLSDEALDDRMQALMPPMMQHALQSYQANRTRPDAMNNPTLYESAVASIAGYDPARDDGGLEKASLTAALSSSFNGPRLKELTNRLETRSVGANQHDNPAKVTGDGALATLGQVLDGGGLGQYIKPKMGPDGKQARGPDTEGLYEKSILGGFFKWKQTETEPGPLLFEEDPKIKAEVGQKAARIRQRFEAERDQGTFKTEKEAETRMLALMAEEGAVMPPQVAGSVGTAAPSGAAARSSGRPASVAENEAKVRKILKLPVKP